MEMHGRHLIKLWIFLVEIETLRLADIWASGNSEIQHALLLDLPHSLVDFAELLRDLFN